MNQRIKKSFLWNTLGSGLNSFNSLFYMIIVTRINGIDDAGVFTLCYATACMLYIIAIYSGRTYQVTETNKSISDNEYIVNRIFSSIVMLFACLIFGFLNHYNTYKFLILLLLCGFKITEAISDVFYGIIQKKERLDLVGKSLFIKSLLNIIFFTIVDVIFNNLVLSCSFLIITNVLVMIIYDKKYVKMYKEKKNNVDFKSVFKIFTFGWYTFLYTLLANYLVNIPRYAIDKNLDSSFQTIFGILVMPASMIMLANQFIFQPVITDLKKYYCEYKKYDFLKLSFNIVLLTSLIGIASLILSYFFGIRILNIIYNLNLNQYLSCLLLIIVGATLYTISSVFSNCLLIMRKTKIQVVIYFITCISAYLISLPLVQSYSINGGIYTYLIMMIILVLLYLLIFLITIRRFNWESTYIKNNRKKRGKDCE